MEKVIQHPLDKLSVAVLIGGWDDGTRARTPR